MSDIRHRVLCALALNRTPGFNFTGNLLGVRFAEITPARTVVSIDHGPYCTTARGDLPQAVFAVLADITLASVVRANLTPEQRLGTVSMHLQMNGRPAPGALTAIGEFDGFLDGALARQGLSRVSLRAGGVEILRGQGAFMVLEPPPGMVMHPIVGADHTRATPLAESTLDDTERAILARADAALASVDGSHAFIDRFWQIGARPTAHGATCSVNNGPHIGNRVGHMQGGLQVGLAASTAETALPADWTLSAISASFISPGVGARVQACARVLHRGARTAVVRTVLVGRDRRRVLEALTTHARRA